MYQKKNKAKNNKEIVYQNLNPFKAEEKKYKLYKDQITDFSELVDVTALSEEELNVNQIVKIGSTYRFPHPQGVYLVKEFLSFEDQIRIAQLCLNDYILPPYRTNLFIYDQQQKFEAETTHDDNKYHFNHKIRWTNVGQQYDWDNRKYPQQKAPVPDPIQEISQRANHLLKIQPQYTAEAVIINFYQDHDYMTGHLDDAELDQVSPIYSFSLGLSCVFLIGGPTKDEKPLALRLDSGDLLVMSGPSRKSYHGVPRVINNSFKHGQIYNPSPLIENRNEEYHVLNYLRSNRININTRQVY
ncbi:hypothetical protein pb186bvf_008220 [Paramecium bursaria]